MYFFSYQQLKTRNTATPHSQKLQSIKYNNRQHKQKNKHNIHTNKQTKQTNKQTQHSNKHNIQTNKQTHHKHHLIILDLLIFSHSVEFYFTLPHLVNYIKNSF